MACDCGGTCGCGTVTLDTTQHLELGVEDVRVQLLAERVIALEAAVIAYFGDTPGHDFHGNQYSGGGGGSEKSQSPRDMLDAMLKEREDKSTANPSWNPKSGQDPIPAAHSKGDTVKLKEKVNARGENPLTGKINSNESFKLIKRGTEGKVLEVGDRFSVVQWKGLSTPQVIRNDMVKL